MTTKYFATLTNQGAALLANATALGTKLNISQMAVGDGNGTLPVPDPAQTKLINQKRIAAINSLSVDANDAGQIIAEQIIPENEGGFFIREIGLFNDDGTLIAVANCPETYKPLLAEGSGRTQTIRMILVVSSTSAITLKIDPSVVLATRKYVDDKVIEVKGYADDLMKKHLAEANPHAQYLLVANALKELAGAELISKVFENLQLGEAAKRNVGNTQGNIPDMSFFGISKSASGYQYLPSGCLIQWGSAIAGTGSIAGDGTLINFPVAFPSVCSQVMTSYDNGASTVVAGASGSLTATNFKLRCSAASGSYNFRWLAIGY
ncbi:phage tail protein [Escherichia coli]|uniref:phage tail protein n=1 Tax=Escherichia coli TaxID=562 RepID=UPI0014835DAC|nr:phage tail protein [Escherichia coli]NNS46369.1 phage tail protein [Escherichia coli]NNS87803.1 phage tail protein [Escherichia coli]NNT91015.1 phage tail protein [Escherichia coli]